MKYRISALLLVLCLVLGTTLRAGAEETTAPSEADRAPGYCGDAIVWEFADGTLTITGTGAMDDFPEGAPWQAHRDEIEKVIVSGGITYIGANAFRDYDALEAVEFGSALYEIGEYAFFSCDGLTAVQLPESFKIFGPSCFMGCSRLTEFHCQGRFPSFRENCLWDTYAKIYFPADRPWGVEYIQQLEEAFHGRIEFLASDGTDPYEPTEPPAETEAPTEEPTEMPTEAPTTVPPTTEPPAEQTTEPLLIMTRPPQTEEPTEAPAEETTEPPAEPEPEKTGGSKTPLIILGAVGAFLVLGSLIFGGGRKRGKYAR